MIGVAGHKGVPDVWLRDLPVPVRELVRQRAIAEYLDTETTRIDYLITKKAANLGGDCRAGRSCLRNSVGEARRCVATKS